ncbi:unnamed protein product [Cylicostephanus goldi]|uniref:PAP-associated domain-containing protein n=1 Tax=Cylicostephanus goldi TaxID=71465 RepID=A0A3P6QE06_CYLGO|nr:unnamed protein product [Cylicostephanus goldi]
MSEFVRDANELLSCPAENFRENLVHPDELRALSRRDQTDVLFRILKEMRREKCGFFKSLYAVSDARCPVIRFSAYDRHLVELSVNNSIGYQKSAYLGALVQNDQSGLLRKLILALRFWAMSNGVFKSEKKKTWNLNSYTITLMFVTFLQSEGLLPVFTHSQAPEYASDNRVDFAVPPYSLAEVDMRSLFKKFFVFCVENQLDKSVFSLRKGAALKQNADSFAVMLGVLKPSESATSPAPSTPATEGSCRVSGFPGSVDDCVMETLMQIILVIILRCENPAMPAKRARFDCVCA